MTQRVALISSSYDPYPGGVEEHTRNVARELRMRGHEVEVWTVDRGEDLGTRTLDDIAVHYLPTPLPSFSTRGALSFVGKAIPAWNAWRRALRRFRPDVLHVQCFGPNGVYAWALSRVAGLPLVVSSHGETFADENNVFDDSRILAWTLRRAVRDAACVTGCSGMVLDDLTGRFGLKKRGCVVANGVDLDEATRLNIGPIERARDQAPTVFAVGRLVRVKGFDLLIRAFAAADLPATARLVIGGDGPERAGLRTLAEELGIGAQVQLPGRLDRASVIRGMATADVIAVPSRSEAFGIVVLEAWRSGKPLVATTQGGPGELVTDAVDGLLASPVDTLAFAHAIALVLADPALAGDLARNGLSKVRDFTWSTTAEQYEGIYGWVIAQQKS